MSYGATTVTTEIDGIPWGREENDEVARSFTDEQLMAALHDLSVTSLADLCRRLALVPRGDNYSRLEQAGHRLGIDLTDHLPATAARRERRKRWRQMDGKEIAHAVAESRSRAEALRRLGVPTDSRGYRRLAEWIDITGVDVSHWRGQAWAKGRRRPDRQIPITDSLVKGQLRASSDLRKRLIREGIKAQRCEQCAGATWQGRPMPLELDHINGDRTDNRLKNLRILCPNCHAQTPTYRGRNIGRG